MMREIGDLPLKSAAEFIAEAQRQINCLDALSAKALYDEAEGAMVIDVREVEQAQKNSLLASVNVPRGLLEMQLPRLCDTPDTLLLVHCAAGGRASLATARLQEMGYTNVYAITEKFDRVKEVFG